MFFNGKEGNSRAKALEELREKKIFYEAELESALKKKGKSDQFNR